MIKHIVLWRLKENAEGNDKTANAKIAKQKLEALVGKVPGLLRAYVGVSIPKPTLEYDLVLECDFESVEALNGYREHPEHVKAATFVRSVVEARTAIDFPVE